MRKPFLLIVYVLVFMVPLSAVAGGTLVMGTTSLPKTLYGGVLSGFATALPSTKLFASPVRYTDSFEPKPYLAKSWELSDDGKTLTLNLVHDAAFTDGKPVTAEDVKFSIHVVQKYHPFGEQIWGSLESIETPDKYTVVLHFSKPNPAVMIGLSPGLLPILPKHVYGGSENLRTDPRLAHNIVGSGPYKLVEFNIGRNIVMKGRDDFFMEGLPKLDQLVMVRFGSDTTQQIALEKGAIGLHATADPTILARAKNKDDIVVAKQGYEALGALIWLEFNTKNKYLKHEKVRHALAYATNVQFMIEQLQGGFSTRSPSPIATGSPFFNPNVPTYDYNLEKARKLLTEAGFPPGEDGTRFALEVTFVPGSPPYGGNIAATLKSQWSKVGVQVTIDSPPDIPTWMSKVANYNFDVTVDNVWNWGDPAIGVARTYLCSNIRKGVPWANMARYCNKKVDKLFAKAATEPNFEQRKQYYFKVQKILTHDLPVYAMMNWPLTNVYSEDVKNPPNGIWGVLSPMLKTSVSE